MAYPGHVERVIVGLGRFNARGDEARERLVLKKMGDEVELLVDAAQAIKDHGFGRMPTVTRRFQGFAGSLIKGLGDAELFKHARDQAQVISSLRAERLRFRRYARAV